MSTPAIETSALGRTYGREEVVKKLDLRVERGTIYGLLGHNGAGKTTTIRMLMGLLSPSSGDAAVLGHDPWRQPVELKRKLGYVPEDLAAYPWMTVTETLRFTASFYPTWDRDLERDLVRRFDLPPARKVSELSRGTRAKLLLAVALAPRPELVILDDATSGLDPLVRREFFESLIELVQAEEQTVLVSSHIIADVERVADRVGVLIDGRLVRDTDLDLLKRAVKQVRVSYNGGAPPPELPPVRRLERDGRAWLLTVDSFDESWWQACQATAPTSAEVLDLSLEDILVELLRPSQSATKPPTGVSDVA